MRPCALVLLASLLPHRAAAAARASPPPASAPIVLWNTTASHCERGGGPIDLPDTPARAFLDADNSTVLVTVDTVARLSRGPSLFATTRDCTIVHNMTGDANPAHYAGNEFLDATFSFGNGTIAALLHTEYPGNVYNACSVEPYTWPACWTVSLSLAVSSDWGRSWAHASPPPSNLVAAVPYPYESSRTIFGWGDTGGILRDPRDGLFYAAAYNRMAKGLQPRGTCVMRTATLLVADSWRGLGSDGAFSVPFASAYTLPPGAEAAHVCSTIDEAIFPAPCVLYGYVYSVFLESFVATVNCNQMAENVGTNYTIYYSTSPDFVRWAPMQLLLHPALEPAWHTNMLTYPALIDPTAPAERGDVNFNTIGQTAVLTYVVRTQNFWKYGASLQGVNVTFEKTREGGVVASVR